MRAVSDALYDRMASDGILATLLGQWDGRPAIITFRPVPEAAGLPMVLAVEIPVDVDRDITNARGREIARDLAIYGRAAEHFDAVEEGAERIRALFHRQPLSVAGHRVISVTATGPIVAPADPDETGRIVTLTIRLDES